MFQTEPFLGPVEQARSLVPGRVRVSTAELS